MAIITLDLYKQCDNLILLKCSVIKQTEKNPWRIWMSPVAVATTFPYKWKTVINLGVCMCTWRCYCWCFDLDNAVLTMSASSSQIRMCTWDSHPLHDLHVNQSQSSQAQTKAAKPSSRLSSSVNSQTDDTTSLNALYQNGNRKRAICSICFLWTEVWHHR